jgi:hypothetical protein
MCTRHRWFFSCTSINHPYPSTYCTKVYLYIPYTRFSRPQSRQSAKLFLQSSELGLPHPFTRRRVCAPSFGPGGGYTLACRREGGGVPIPTRGHTLWYSIGIYCMYFVVTPLNLAQPSYVLYELNVYPKLFSN